MLLAVPYNMGVGVPYYPVPYNMGFAVPYYPVPYTMGFCVEPNPDLIVFGRACCLHEPLCFSAGTAEFIFGACAVCLSISLTEGSRVVLSKRIVFIFLICVFVIYFEV